MTMQMPLRDIRMQMKLPPRLEEIAEYARRRGLRCTAAHLSAVERGTRHASERLLAVIADYYKMDRAELDAAQKRTRDLARRRAS